MNVAKATAKPAAKKKAGFDRSKLNPSFFNNAKSNKDQAAGWAFDFENPDAEKPSETTDNSDQNKDV